MKTCSSSLLLLCLTLPLCAQPASPPPPEGGPGFGGPPPFAPGGNGPGGFGGPGGPGGMDAEATKLVKQFDKDGDKWLNAEERKAARAFIVKERAEGRSVRRGPPGGRRMENTEPPAAPGSKVSPSEVKSYPNVPLYDPKTLRTLFLQFDNADWEKELADFNNTDVEVPAKLTADGKTYASVGVHFRGASSYFTVGEGHKRSLGVSMDFADKKQSLGGYRTLNLLNSHEDPTFLRTVLFSQIARTYIPTPQANYVRVVINGENWGVYVNEEQFNKDFIKEAFGTEKGARWHVHGSPRGQGSLAYLGDDASAYKKIYTIKSKDDPKSWADLIKLCKVLKETPTNQLEAALAPLLDVDGALKFLALENALINNDGYWVRSSDYNLYQDEKGRFHVISHDSNETFSKPGGPGFGGGPGGGPGGRGRNGLPSGGSGAPGLGGHGGPGAGFGGGGGAARVEGVKLDPLVAANDASKPLLSKLLAVPALRAKYLGYVRDIAEKWLDWEKLGPIAREHQALIAAEVKADTRKLDSTENFTKGLTEDIAGKGGGPGRGGSIGLKSFADQRRAYLLQRSEAPR